MIQTGDAKHPQLSLIEHFKDLPDPRVDRTKDHELIDVLTIAIWTLLCAGESFNDVANRGERSRAAGDADLLPERGAGLV